MYLQEGSRIPESVEPSRKRPGAWGRSPRTPEIGKLSTGFYVCPIAGIKAFDMYIFKVQGFYECPFSWVHFKTITGQKHRA